ncbi:hypothetical protein [Echinicola vietnamensis]|uniref:Lipocalin-like domain-containing protein n=1 Tax=Echinicola vietnamensis (strain DSM 17526 / LMG 23754 / KMM 6221) TaxID=926556 RepID=L0G0J9_ECHVK|nr:hypothetical protein [Echinicola vietnamensis]AGA78506.1 hypothetical protein Echvi_2258 [Echinicola vietnamensis DSM 17526]
MTRLHHTIFALISFTLLFSCGGDEDPTPAKSKEQVALEKLTADGTQAWVLGTDGFVTHKGQDKSSDFADFEIIFSHSGGNQAYTSANSNLLFDESGTWAFEGDNFTKISLSGTQPAAGQEIAFSGQGNKLRLEFNVPTPTNGRVTALAGDYVFMLEKK